jgi:hypothetical protein
MTGLLRTSAVGALILMVGVAGALAAPAEKLVQTISFEHDSTSWWSDIMGPLGYDHYLDWTFVDGGKPGVAGKPDSDVNWDREGWRKLSLQWDRPKGATAFTIFFRYRDGVCRFKKTIDCATEPYVASIGSRAMADWVVIRASEK